ncbi:MAG TPA: hypothetical protein VK738_01525 [Terriglobales bacterium]|nr:hypothetical protein [Terriglobales bacterium]
MPLCRAISQYLMLGLLTSGTLYSQMQAPALQPATNQTPGALVHKRSSGQTARKNHTLSSWRVALPPYKLPPSPPRISYVNGELTVVANNSTLSDVLNAIQSATGAKIEGVTPASTDRVFGQFGPDSPRTVCSTLLTGSGYDFVIMESADNRGSLQQIILTARSTELADSPSSQSAVASESPAGDTSDSQDMADANEQATDANQAQMTPEQQQQLPPQDQPSTQNQQATQGQQPGVAPTHPQHWGANYQPPPQTTQQNQQEQQQH